MRVRLHHEQARTEGCALQGHVATFTADQVAALMQGGGASRTAAPMPGRRSGSQPRREVRRDPPTRGAPGSPLLHAFQAGDDAGE
ncbi:hypothetical protein GCM10009555_038200 [Acrocarpospora macrocephala]|uniref:Uncharacterized protein n=1 Tax=Acrocarpospora macrocephala TaxID=150177 RepID=A0A5M3WM46_9ACTN|nr:hypothetical protein Amac_033020 [Acrocarpospora macrocephala]